MQLPAHPGQTGLELKSYSEVDSYQTYMLASREKLDYTRA